MPCVPDAARPPVRSGAATAILAYMQLKSGCGPAGFNNLPFRSAIQAVSQCDMACFALQYGLFWSAKWPILQSAGHQTVTLTAPDGGF